MAAVGCCEGRQDFRVDAGVVVGGETADGGIMEAPAGFRRQGSREFFCSARHLFIHAFSLFGQEEALSVQFRCRLVEESDGGCRQVLNVRVTGEFPLWMLPPHRRVQQ